jgi:hypothetical protein
VSRHPLEIHDILIRFERVHDRDVDGIFLNAAHTRMAVPGKYRITRTVKSFISSSHKTVSQTDASLSRACLTSVQNIYRNANVAVLPLKSAEGIG